MISRITTLAFVSLLATVSAQQYPQLKLPWGTWEATPLPEDPNIYLFKNVRFGAVPKRFGAPKFPDWTDEALQVNSGELSCIQVTTSELKTPPGGRNPLGDEITPSKETEDCLFLDLYVPKAFSPDAPQLPITVWIYGGAYAFGSKSQFGPLYTGQSLLSASKYNTIFVVGNYRVGTFGWLAGYYMERHAQPNAGLYDQALLFEWVQKYIHLVGGNKSSVSAWGESAGAGSILHHLIRRDGDYNPLFTSFFAQSPAFEWAWDNTEHGKLDRTFANFSQLAGCDGYNITCLREASVENVQKANQELFNVVRQTGLFPVGPAVDGDWVRSIPAVSFAYNKTWKGINSAIISHCANEAHSFTPKGIDSQARFDESLEIFLPGSDLRSQRDKIRHQYNCTKMFDSDFTKCIREVIQDLSFTCNTRQLFDSYPTVSYMMEYAFPFANWAYHGSDLIPLFTNNLEEANMLLEQLGLPQFIVELYSGVLDLEITPRYQNYLASFAALRGNPNGIPFDPPLTWPVADGSGDKLSNVMKVQMPGGQGAFELGSDNQNSKSKCDFWTGLAQSIVHQAAGDHGNQKLLFEQAPDYLIDLEGAMKKSA